MLSSNTSAAPLTATTNSTSPIVRPTYKWAFSQKVRKVMAYDSRCHASTSPRLRVRGSRDGHRRRAGRRPGSLRDSGLSVRNRRTASNDGGAAYQFLSERHEGRGAGRVPDEPAIASHAGGHTRVHALLRVRRLSRDRRLRAESRRALRRRAPPAAVPAARVQELSVQGEPELRAGFQPAGIRGQHAHARNPSDSRTPGRTAVSLDQSGSIEGAQG